MKITNVWGELLTPRPQRATKYQGFKNQVMLYGGWSDAEDALVLNRSGEVRDWHYNSFGAVKGLSDW